MLHLAWTMIEIWGSNAKVVIVLFVILNMWNTSHGTSRMRMWARPNSGDQASFRKLKSSDGSGMASRAPSWQSQ